jgi:hypothetical protein
MVLRIKLKAELGDEVELRNIPLCEASAAPQ